MDTVTEAELREPVINRYRVKRGRGCDLAIVPRCVLCGRRHVHGAPPEGRLGNRVAHCRYPFTSSALPNYDLAEVGMQGAESPRQAARRKLDAKVQRFMQDNGFPHRGTWLIPFEYPDGISDTPIFPVTGERDGFSGRPIFGESGALIEVVAERQEFPLGEKIFPGYRVVWRANGNHDAPPCPPIVTKDDYYRVHEELRMSPEHSEMFDKISPDSTPEERAEYDRFAKKMWDYAERETPRVLAGLPPTTPPSLRRTADAIARVPAPISPQANGAVSKKQSTVSASAKTVPSEESQPAELQRLANLSRLEYDHQREEAAKRLGCRVGTLDAEIAQLRGTATEDQPAGDSVLFPQREVWPSQINGAALLDELKRTFRRFVVMSDDSAIACALWTVFTHMIDGAAIAPILAAQSAEKRSGKTTLLDLLGRLVRRALATSNLSAAALFRSVEKWTPTLLIDEADTFLRTSDELRGVLNAGHTRTSAFVLRCVGDDSEPRRFSTWSAKAIALIGRLPDTLEDRSIVVELRRRLQHEQIERLRHAPAKLFEELARQAERFARDNAAAFKSARPQIPEKLHDRAADCWEPLIAIAELAGKPWAEQARGAALALSGGTAEQDSIRVELLRDVRNVFTATGAERITSAAMCEALAADPEGRWREYTHGKPITPRQVAKLLRPFSIVPNTIRADDSTAKGYKHEDFADAFRRYLPPSDPSQGNNQYES